MKENNYTRLTLESYDNKITWEATFSDVSMKDLLCAFYGICVAATWIPQTVLEGMREFADANLKLYDNPTVDQESTDKFHKKLIEDLSKE